MSGGIDKAAVERLPTIAMRKALTFEEAEAIAALTAHAEKLEWENEALRAALRFYADTSKYPAPFTGGWGNLYFDCGQVARAALSAPDRQREG